MIHRTALLIALALTPISGTAEELEPVTPLDRAFIAAKRSQSDQPRYYDAFLVAEIFIPTTDPPEATAKRHPAEGDAISPLFVESEGTRYLMLFDSEARLATWAQREIGWVSLPGHAIAEMMDPHTLWVLNAGTDFSKVFSEEEIEWLKEISLASRGEEADTETSLKILVGAPADVPSGLVDSIATVLASNDAVEAAYLGQVYIQTPGAVPRLAVAVSIAANRQAESRAIREEIAGALGAARGARPGLDVYVVGSDEVGSEIALAVEPFFRR